MQPLSAWPGCWRPDQPGKIGLGGSPASARRGAERSGALLWGPRLERRYGRMLRLAKAGMHECLEAWGDELIRVRVVARVLWLFLVTCDGMLLHKVRRLC